MALLFSCFTLFIYLYVSYTVCVCVHVCEYCMHVYMMSVCVCLCTWVNFQGNGNNHFLMEFQGLPPLPLLSHRPSLHLSVCLCLYHCVCFFSLSQKAWNTVGGFLHCVCMFVSSEMPLFCNRGITMAEKKTMYCSILKCTSLPVKFMVLFWFEGIGDVLWRSAPQGVSAHHCWV